MGLKTNPAPRPKTTYTLEDVAEFQEDARRCGSKLDAVTHFAEHYDHLTPRFLSRHLETLINLDPGQLVKAIGYPDPVGEAAVRQVMNQQSGRMSQRV